MPVESRSPVLSSEGVGVRDGYVAAGKRERLSVESCDAMLS